jgi:hypothetical protein
MKTAGFKFDHVPSYHTWRRGIFKSKQRQSIPYRIRQMNRQMKRESCRIDRQNVGPARIDWRKVGPGCSETDNQAKSSQFAELLNAPVIRSSSSLFLL